jgi:hypothetical protein
MICKECGGEFILNPDKPGFANVCPICTEPAELLAKKAAAVIELQETKRQRRKPIKRVGKRENKKSGNWKHCTLKQFAIFERKALKLRND